VRNDKSAQEAWFQSWTKLADKIHRMARTMKKLGNISAPGASTAAPANII